MSAMPENPQETTQPMPAQALAALERGEMIEAIKIVRMEHRTGLKEAKDFVDRYLEGNPALKAAVRAHSIRIGPAQVFRFLAIVALIVVVFLWWKNG